MSHPTENELLEYAEGQGDPVRRARVKAHLAQCGACSGLVGAAFSDPGALPTGSGGSLVGQKLGDYVVDEEIGHGGMGIVYRGRQPVIGKTVAIKVLRPEVAAEDPQLVERLLAEARAVNAIGHRGIVDIFGFGETPQGQHYIVMEYLVGETLTALLAAKGRLSPYEAITVLEGFLGALGSAHAAGVVHRDLKPSNLFLVHQPDGARLVKLLDFGLARNAEGGGPRTAPGVTIGTPDYMAPEQVRSSAVGPRADLYSVGVIAFQLLTGRRPYRAATPQGVIELVLEAPVPRVSSLQPRVHPQLDDLVFQLMKKRPEERPGSAEEVGQALAAVKRVLEATDVSAQATDPALAATDLVSAVSGLADDSSQLPPRPRRRWPWVLVALAALGAAVTVWLVAA